MDKEIIFLIIFGVLAIALFIAYGVALLRNPPYTDPRDFH